MNSHYVFSQSAAPRGLQNINNTCYMNAVIQCILSVSGFSDSSVTASTQINYKPYYGLVRDAFCELVTAMKGEGAAYASYNFKGMVSQCWPNFVEGRQEDVEEFFSFLCSALHEDLQLQSEASPYDVNDEYVVSAVVQMWRSMRQSVPSWYFHRQIVSLQMCSSCQSICGTYNDVSWVLQLSIKENCRKTNVSECLAISYADEFLEDSQCLNCSKYGRRHRLLLGRLPPVLVIQLKRFAHKHSKTTKVKTSVEVDPEINLAAYCVEGVQSSTTYSLLGVITHNGSSPQSGHYKAVTKRGNRWYTFDDSKVTNTTSRSLSSVQAYLLFYEQQKVPDGQLPLDNDLIASVEDCNNNKKDDPSCKGTSNAFQDIDEFQGNLVSQATPVANEGFDPAFIEEECRRSSPVGTDRVMPLPVDFPDNDLSSDLFEDSRASPEFSEPTGLPHEDDVFDLAMYDEERQRLNSEEPVGKDKALVPSDDEMEDDFTLPQTFHTLQISHGDNNIGNVEVQSTPTQCNHPNFDLDMVDPVLTEDDIPGAKLDLHNLSKYKVSELQFWLACRGLHQTGRKEELKERILNHQRLAHKINPGVGKGAWYNAKRRELMDKVTEARRGFPLMPMGMSVWKPFPSAHIPNKFSTEKALQYLRAIPEIRFSHSEGVVVIPNNGGDVISDDEDDMFDMTPPTPPDRKRLFVDGTIKRSNQFIDSGRVLSVDDCEKDKHYFVKAQVQASMVNTVYGVNVIMSKASGNVCLADCHCKARALHRCCHVMAVLLLIGRHVELRGHEAITCTGRRCYWIGPSSSSISNPGVTKDKHEYYLLTDYQRRAYFDPRPKDVIEDQGEERLNSLKRALSSMSTKLLWHFHLQEPVHPVPIDVEDFPDITSTEVLADLCSYLIWNLNQIKHYSSSGPLHFPLTQLQSMSLRWPFERAVRIPASCSQQALGLLSPRSTDMGKINFMRQHMWQLDAQKLNNLEAVKYGKALEPNARQAYTAYLKLDHLDYEVIETGIWVNPLYPYLSCSPDSLVVNVNGIVKLVEFKSPFTLRGVDPNEYESHLTPKQLQHFCLHRNKETGNVELRQSNKWYFQIQQSLAILELKTCDFILYSEIELESGVKVPKFLMLEVPFNESFWTEKVDRLRTVHRQIIVPEFFLYNAVFKRPLKVLVYSPFHEDYDDNYFYLDCDPDFTLTVENENEVLINYSQRGNCL